MASKPRLKPCPFCGGPGEYGVCDLKESPQNEGGEFIQCVECKASTTLMFAEKCDAKPLLAELWNRRPRGRKGRRR